MAFLNEKNPVTVCAKDTEGEPVYDTSLLVAPTFNLTILISPVNAVRNVSATIPIQNLPGCVNFTFTPTRLTQVNMSILWNFENIKDSPFAILVVDPGVKIGKHLIRV